MNKYNKQLQLAEKLKADEKELFRRYRRQAETAPMVLLGLADEIAATRTALELLYMDCPEEYLDLLLELGHPLKTIRDCWLTEQKMHAQRGMAGLLEKMKRGRE